jgi:hypothetical protein
VGTRQNCDHPVQLLIKYGADINRRGRIMIKPFQNVLTAQVMRLIHFRS